MINLNINDIIFLEGKKDLIQNALFCPAISAHIDAVPTAKLFRQATPFAAVLCDIKYGVKHLQIRYFSIQQLYRN